MMSQSVDLVVDFCSYQAAKFAVMNWHYSKAMPAGKLVKIGVWENGRFVGCVLFGRGVIYNIGKPYNLKQTQCVELVRVALDTHVSFTSKIVSLAIKILKSQSEGLRMVVSFADSKRGHLGVIYQALNWIYVASIVDRVYYKLDQQCLHGRSIYAKYGTQSLQWLRDNIDINAEMITQPPKHKYLYPLDRKMRRQIEPLRKPYPKHADS